MTGKTMTALALAGEMGVPLFMIRLALLDTTEIDWAHVAGVSIDLAHAERTRACE
ncbi:MAG: hypothetical protein V3V08_01255 [Nannocystaceae bacterium]